MALWSEMCALCKTQFILTCILMAGLLTLILLIDYYKMQKKKTLIWTFGGILAAIGCAIYVLNIIEINTEVLGTITDIGTYYSMITIGILAFSILVISIITIIVLERMRVYSTKKTWNTVLFSAIAFMGVLLLTAIILITWVYPADNQKIGNIHIASLVGFPALILLSIGTLIVIQNEPKLVVYHGLTAGGAWVLTALNVLSLFSMDETSMNGFSGWIHAFHILCGAVGLIGGFLSALFGISGQRKLAKMTGYITLGCWWTAYMVASFIVGVAGA